MENKGCNRWLAFRAVLQAGIVLYMYFGLFAAANAEVEVKNVLIISSYHQGFKWSRDITDGIIDTFKEGNFNITTHIEYMDWKNYPTEENIRFFKNYLEYKYKNKKIDILIAEDDAALKFVLENRGSLFSDVPVVFCGINEGGLAELIKGCKNVTGVLEEIDPTDTINLALSINPSLKNIYVLFDNSESGLSTGEIVMNRIKEMGLRPVPLNNLPYEQLLEDAKNYRDDSIILVTTYYSDGTGRIIDFEIMSQELEEASSVPVYHLYDMAFGKGAFGGVMTGGRFHGEKTAEIALRILGGEKPDEIQILPPETTRKAIDYNQLEKFGITLDRVPVDTEIINKPFSFFETYKTLVLSITAVFIVLISLILLLSFYISKIKRMKEKLQASNEELGQLYEELAASEEELKLKYNEILDINEQIRASEEKLSYLAYHDALTGLPNKLSLYQYNLSRKKGRTALLFIDMDHFKYINDTMGHVFGDLVIYEAGQRLNSFAKDNCTVYRLGGDEFLMLAEGIRDMEAAEALASEIAADFRKEFYVRDSMIRISLSIGVVIYPDHGDTMEELVRHADIAMYKAKEAGRNRYVIYNHTMNEAFAERVNIEKYLHSALRNNEFELYYQPQINTETGTIVSLEALLRWNSPILGVVPPLKFIKVAEDTRLIIPLGEWVLRKACEFLKELHIKGYNHLSISVNISMIQLLQTDFNNMVLQTIRSFGLEPGCLELEITESVLMESFERLGANLEELKRNGIRIALDDFGKGYSSLNYLKQLPVSTLKVDKSFIDSIPEVVDANALIKHIIALGKSMGMCVVAEGVERAEQLTHLASFGCDRIQGYLYSRPVPRDELLLLLEKNTSGMD